MNGESRGRFFTCDGMKPSQGRRPWVKLWVNDWLEGTTRFQMSDAQRAFWIDLLAMAGRSRFGGVVCAGKDGEVWIGYPISKFQGLLAEPLDIEATFDLFQRTGKIKLEVSGEGSRMLYTIWILNWARYQSEYERKRAERAKRKGNLSPEVPSDVPNTSGEVSHPMSQECTSTEERREKKDGDGEKRERASLSPPTPETITRAFGAMKCEPFGSKAFQALWAEEWSSPSADGFSDSMERCIQRAKSLRIEVPGRFFQMKREVEKTEAAVAGHELRSRTPL